MSRAPDQLAPSWLPRQQRRWIDAKLRKLFQAMPSDRQTLSALIRKYVVTQEPGRA